MGSNVDDAKGRVKEAAGDIADNDRLKREGKADQAGAKVKEFADDVKDKVEDAVDKVKDKLHRD
ncbi:MAG TPA: CsbD family protein [Acidimicrobiales bacterium]|nr:CsbD family protein [Acidimicrobiales bacterium]